MILKIKMIGYVLIVLVNVFVQDVLEMINY